MEWAVCLFAWQIQECPPPTPHLHWGFIFYSSINLLHLFIFILIPFQIQPSIVITLVYSRFHDRLRWHVCPLFEWQPQIVKAGLYPLLVSGGPVAGLVAVCVMWQCDSAHSFTSTGRERSIEVVQAYTTPACCGPPVPPCAAVRLSRVGHLCMASVSMSQSKGSEAECLCAIVSCWILLYINNLKQCSGEIHQIFVSSSPAKCSQMFLKPTSGREVTGACVLLQWDGFHPGSPFPRRTMRSCPVAALTSPVWPSGHRCPTLNGCWGRRIWPLKMTCPLGETCWNSPTSGSRPTTRASPCQRWAL